MRRLRFHPRCGGCSCRRGGASCPRNVGQSVGGLAGGFEAVVSSPRISPHALKGLLLVRIRMARSWRRQTSMNMRFAAWGSHGM